jgi:hypothetical protein
MQFERQGYSVRDADSTLDHQVFNRNDRLAQYVCEGSRRQRLADVRFGARVISTTRGSLPVFPDKQTISAPVGTSHLCQRLTHAPQQLADSFDHLVNPQQERLRNR